MGLVDLLLALFLFLLLLLLRLLLLFPLLLLLLRLLLLLLLLLFRCCLLLDCPWDVLDDVLALLDGWLPTWSAGVSFAMLIMVLHVLSWLARCGNFRQYRHVVRMLGMESGL